MPHSGGCASIRLRNRLTTVRYPTWTPPLRTRSRVGTTSPVRVTTWRMRRRTWHSSPTRSCLTCGSRRRIVPHVRQLLVGEECHVRLRILQVVTRTGEVVPTLERVRNG